MVPGVCNGAGNTGVGCGYDITELELFGLTINPKKPVVKMPPYPLKCYTNPDDQSDECEYSTLLPATPATSPAVTRSAE